MPEKRFFLDISFQNNLSAQLENEELHHLRVMRCQIGTTLELVNGQNQLAKATLTHLDKQIATLTLTNVITKPPPTRQIILAQALLRPKNLDLVIEKGTELGATAFWLFPAERSEKTTLSPNQLERLRHLTISALKQCGRLDLPTLLTMPPLSQWSQPPGTLFYGDLHSQDPLPPSQGDITFFIGPEKGFSPAEENCLKSLHAKGIRLNPHTLRAETAALCAISLLLSN